MRGSSQTQFHPTAPEAAPFAVPPALDEPRINPMIGAGRTAAAPTRPESRLLAPDVLRGIAVLGILPMNMQIFAMHPASVVYPYAGAFTDGKNIAAWIGLRILIGSTVLSLFSMLFGAGMLMFDDSRRRAGANPTILHYRRMAALLVIGLGHAYLIWGGDILVTYALCGALIYLFRNWSPRQQVILGAAAYAVPMMLILAGHFLVPQLPAGISRNITALFSPGPEQIAEFNRAYGAGWLEQMPQRLSDAVANQTGNFLLCMGWIVAGMMLIGMGLFRSGVLSARGPDRTYRRMILVAAIVGYPLLIYSFVWSANRNWRLPDGFLLGWFFRESAYPIILLGWIGATMLVCKHGKLCGTTGTLAAAGRMALTNYLVQSILCSLIFHGHGLGLVGKVDLVGQIAITLVIWTAQLIYSPIWLRHFRFGPAEWLWRSISYGRRQPMRSTRALAPA